MLWPDVAETLNSIVSAIIGAALGAFFTNKSNKNSHNIIENNKAINHIIELSNQMEDEGISYWAPQDSDWSANKRIICEHKIKSLSNKISEQLSNYLDIQEGTRYELRRFRQSITGNKFESRPFNPKPSYLPIINSTASSFRAKVMSFQK